jgi:hypothetical protein
MKKLSLNLEELHVESFDASHSHPDEHKASPARPDRRGTVQARESGQGNTLDGSCYIECDYSVHCGYTAAGTCEYTCGCKFSDLCSALC